MSIKVLPPVDLKARAESLKSDLKFYLGHMQGRELTGWECGVRDMFHQCLDVCEWAAALLVGEEPPADPPVKHSMHCASRLVWEIDFKPGTDELKDEYRPLPCDCGAASFVCQGDCVLRRPSCRADCTGYRFDGPVGAEASETQTRTK